MKPLFSHFGREPGCGEFPIVSRQKSAVGSEMRMPIILMEKIFYIKEEPNPMAPEI